MHILFCHKLRSPAPTLFYVADCHPFLFTLYPHQLLYPFFPFFPSYLNELTEASLLASALHSPAKTLPSYQYINRQIKH